METNEQPIQMAVRTRVQKVSELIVGVIKNAYQWFMALPNREKIAVAMTLIGIPIILFTILTTVLRSSPPKTKATNASAAIPYPDLVPAPLGFERFNSTAEQLAWRAERMIETRTFWIMREGEALKGAERINQKEYQEHIHAAAKQYGVNPSDIEAIHYLESFGSETAKSPTGPKGPGQFTVRTASNIGPVAEGKCLVRFEGIPCGQPLPEKLPRVVEDNRENVKLSVFATAKLLSDEINFFGDRKFAIMAYHSSRNSVRNWVKKFLEPKETNLGGKADIQKYGLTFELLYFGSTPYKNPGTYKMYRELMDVDWGPNYPWKVLDSAKLLQQYRDNPAVYAKIASDNKYRGKRAKYRMWTFYDDERDEADTLKTLADLKSKIANGSLVTIPNNPEKFGFKLRLEGHGVIAEFDKTNQKDYIATKPETAGAALWISEAVKQLRENGGSKPFLLDITSVTRTVQYQQKLVKNNPTATKELSFHVLGSAFDIAKSSLSADQDRDLRFVLDELDSTGMISWVPELKAYHIVVAPNEKAIEFFKRFFNDQKGFQMASPLILPAR